MALLNSEVSVNVRRLRARLDRGAAARGADLGDRFAGRCIAEFNRPPGSDRAGAAKPTLAVDEHGPSIGHGLHGQSCDCYLHNHYYRSELVPGAPDW